jgi:hypothetical protein
VARAWLLALAGAALQACAPDPQPEFVYVPADGYVTSVEISLPGEARAGEWVKLSAQRRSGPWRRVKREEAPPGFVPFGAPPAEFEPEVAANLFWMTEPASGVRFDLPGDRSERRVRFADPGAYQVWARSAYPTDAKSNVVTVQVRR